VRFDAPLGTRERLSALAAIVVIVGGSIVVGVVMTARTGDLRWLFVSLPFTLMLLLAARLAPSGYRLAADGVHVERKAGPKVIPYEAIRAVDREPRSPRGVTVTGSNGLFGRFGRFWNPRLGLYRLFLSNTETVVWLTTREGLVGLSPDRPDEFVERLAARVPRAPH
jgi:hypothetical protein